MKPLCLAVPLLFLLAGCHQEPERMPFYGKWDANFTPANAPQSRYILKGYAELYRMRNSFVLHLEGEQQGIDVRGVWTVERNQVILTPDSTEIDDHGGADARDPNLVYLANEDVRKAFQPKMAFRPSADKTHLQAPRMAIGPVPGTLTLSRP